MQQAHRAWPNPAFNFNVAQLQRELGMCPEARRNYQAFLEHEREPGRRQQAELALAELAQCAPNGRTPEAAAGSCAAWTEAALGASKQEAGPASRPVAAQSAAAASVSAVPGPAEVARTSSHKVSPLSAADLREQPRPRKSSVPRYLPWVFAGVGVLCVGLAGYELAQISAAERGIENSRESEAENQALARDGQSAQTMFWVYASAGTLAFSSALVLALVGDSD